MTGIFSLFPSVLFYFKVSQIRSFVLFTYIKFYSEISLNHLCLIGCALPNYKVQYGEFIIHRVSQSN